MRTLSLLSWFLLLFASACGDQEPSPPDGGPGADGDDTVAATPLFPSEAERIVSLVPAATAIMIELGATDRLVGRTDFDTAAAVEALPSVGGGIRPDLERLLSLDPDLVVVFAGESDVRTRERLRRAGVEVHGVRPDDVEDVLAMIRALGAGVGRGPEADAMAGSIDRRLEEVRRRVEGRPARRVAFLVGGTPPWVAGPGTFVHELLGIAGGENVFHDLDGLYGAVSAEALVARRPDILLIPEGTPAPEDTGGARIVEVPAWVAVPGPSLGRSADTLARILHPGALP